MMSNVKLRKNLKISDLSRLTGVPVSTLRLWGENGLLIPELTPKGYRIYNEAHVSQVGNIRRLRTLQGLSLAAIKATLADAAPDNAPGLDRYNAKNINVTEDNPIGTKLRALRHAKRVTLNEVADETGINASALASMERTSMGMRITELKTLAGYYGITLTSLISEGSDSNHRELVVPAGGGQILPTLGKGLRIEQLASGNDMMDCQRWFIEPGVSSHGAYSHEGEELVFVLMGEIEITIEDARVHLLRQGDSIYFRSSWQHSWYNPGRTTTILLWVNTPPSF